MEQGRTCLPPQALDHTHRVHDFIALNVKHVQQLTKVFCPIARVTYTPTLSPYVLIYFVLLWKEPLISKEAPAELAGKIVTLLFTRDITWNATSFSSNCGNKRDPSIAWCISGFKSRIVKAPILYTRGRNSFQNLYVMLVECEWCVHLRWKACLHCHRRTKLTQDTCVVTGRVYI